MDNEVFTMSFGRCHEISTSTSQSKQDHYLFISEDCPKTCTAKVYSNIMYHWNLTLNIYNFLGFEFYCLGSWTDEDGNVWMGVRDRGEDVHRYKYRCLVSLN